ncbi:unnamed protein product [Gordionus sp. m RMFG-2023]
MIGKIDWQKNVDLVAKDLIKKLLVHDRTKRLGNMKNGANDVKLHKWFKGIDWIDVFSKKIEPPIIPMVSFNGDCQNFEEYIDDESFFKEAPNVSNDQRNLFKDF